MRLAGRPRARVSGRHPAAVAGKRLRRNPPVGGLGGGTGDRVGESNTSLLSGVTRTEEGGPSWPNGSCERAETGCWAGSGVQGAEPEPGREVPSDPGGRPAGPADGRPRRRRPPAPPPADHGLPRPPTAQPQPTPQRPTTDRAGAHGADGIAANLQPRMQFRGLHPAVQRQGHLRTHPEASESPGPTGHFPISGPVGQESGATNENWVASWERVGYSGPRMRNPGGRAPPTQPPGFKFRSGE